MGRSASASGLFATPDSEQLIQLSLTDTLGLPALEVAVTVSVPPAAVWNSFVLLTESVCAFWVTVSVCELVPSVTVMTPVLLLPVVLFVYLTVMELVDFDTVSQEVALEEAVHPVAPASTLTVFCPAVAGAV